MDAPSPASPSITLRTEQREHRVAIVIEDRGIGIDPDDRSRMFDPYFTTKRGGTGLGLAIAKNIVEGLRGTIAVTSVPGSAPSSTSTYLRMQDCSFNRGSHKQQAQALRMMPPDFP